MTLREKKLKLRHKKQNVNSYKIYKQLKKQGLTKEEEKLILHELIPQTPFW